MRRPTRESSTTSDLSRSKYHISSPFNHFSALSGIPAGAHTAQGGYQNFDNNNGGYEMNNNNGTGYAEPYGQPNNNNGYNNNGYNNNGYNNNGYNNNGYNNNGYNNNGYNNYQ
jgi:hypothetical protein